MKRPGRLRNLRLFALVLFILLGRPRQVDLQGAEVILHFDQDGRLLTQQASARGPRGRFPDMDVKALTAALHDLPVRLAGKVSGTVQGTVTPATPGKSRVVNASVV